jgi:hypothetical protein
VVGSLFFAVSVAAAAVLSSFSIDRWCAAVYTSQGREQLHHDSEANRATV